MADVSGLAARSDEDCLTLNVHRPQGADADAGLPVMFWIHGGGFVFGSGSQAVYNSPELVRRGVVLVTVNYRLGALGLLAHPALQEDGSRVANFGLLDQLAALQWVQDNIEAFGGDPDAVTIFGESAGGIAVNTLMATPSAEGLFSKAISQSGFGREGSVEWAEALAQGGPPVPAVAGEAPTAETLRGLDVDTAMSMSTRPLGSLAPVVDDVLPQSVSSAFAAGDELDVPYVVGTTDSEIPNAGVEQLGPAGGAVWALLRGALAADTAAAYGGDAARDLYLGSDVLFTEPARHLARAHADDAPTYLYRFGIAPENVLAAGGGAPHTAEIAFVFDDTARQGTPVPNADALADAVADLWVRFATDGDPGGWPTAETGQVMAFTVGGAAAVADPWAPRLDLVQTAYEQAVGP
jgi:para-nitrobenzyl esterase